MSEETPGKGASETPAPGSPEANAAKIAAMESGDHEPQAKPDDGDAGEGGEQKPEDVVKLAKAEHDALFGELRKLRKERREREEAEAKRTREEQQAQAKAEGDFEKALGLERTEKEAALNRARSMGLKLALTEACEEREWTPAQRKLARKLIDVEALEFDEDGEPTTHSVDEALKKVAEEYPEAFAKRSSAEGSANNDDSTPGGDKPRTRKTPANPAQAQKPFDGFISPEEYMSTPWNVRMSQDFQKRVELSRPLWPEKVPHDSFPGGSGES